MTDLFHPIHEGMHDPNWTVIEERKAPYGGLMDQRQGHDYFDSFEPNRYHNESLDGFLEHYVFTCNTNFICIKSLCFYTKKTLRCDPS